MTKLAHWPMPSLLSHVVWVSGRQFATVVVCFSFASIEFSLKRFLSFFDCFMTAGLSTVQVRDKRPTHTQKARTIFAQTRVEKRVLAYAFARI